MFEINEHIYTILTGDIFRTLLIWGSAKLFYVIAKLEMTSGQCVVIQRTLSKIFQITLPC